MHPRPDAAPETESREQGERVSTIVPRGKSFAGTQERSRLPSVGKLVATGLRAAETAVMHVIWRDASRRFAPASPRPAGVVSRILDTTEILEASIDPTLDLEPGFGPRASAKGDRCVGVFVDGQLASYGWYASNATEVVYGLGIAWTSPSTLYMYKGFTHPAYRGRGLYALGLIDAVELLSVGRPSAPNLFAFVRRDNVPSLRAAARAGYVADGAFVASRHFGSRGLLTPSVRRRGLRLTRA